MIPSVPGPSRSSPPGDYPIRAVDENDAFAERFKYLICSSGVLEKDYVPGLSGGEADTEEEAGSARGGRAWWVEKGRERWDVVVAVGVLVLAMAVLMGPKVLLLLLIFGAILGAWVSGRFGAVVSRGKVV